MLLLHWGVPDACCGRGVCLRVGVCFLPTEALVGRLGER